ncbi:hypothetical protein [Micrococcus sp.]|uniref:hypothetical protein n=1 Tax=Micrococcus sp. TaxID=1271 RepID=UPI0026DB0F43|nr:hypothetical protein [Micrococcus sp.]MDO4239752.1 hypothetical protein [Micrococcus sp.]
MTSPHTHDVATPATEASHTTTDPRRDTRPRWGRSARLGGGTGRLLLVSLVLGLLIALLIGAAAYGLATLREHPDPRYPWIMGLVMAATSLPIGAGVAWVRLVDRTTIRGAIRNTEETVEGRWLEKAQSGAFGDLLVVIGLGTFVIGMTGWQLSSSLTGAALIVVAAASAAVRYLLLKWRG